MSMTKRNTGKNLMMGRAGWLGAATTVALLASSSIVVSAPRADREVRMPRSSMTTLVRNEGPNGGSVSQPGSLQIDAATTGVIRWLNFTRNRPAVHNETPNGMGTSESGDLRTDAARTGVITWLVFTRNRPVHNEVPNGMGSSESGDVRTDAARTGVIRWLNFTRNRPAVDNESPNGMGTSVSGDLRTEALSGHAFRPSLVYGIGRGDDGGARAEIGLTFRLR